jgi:hypothetical protein
VSTPGNEPPAEQVATPTVSTAPSGTAEPPHSAWWHWNALPHHLGRARTSTVILSVLFLAIFALYLNVRPDVTTDTTPAGGGSDVEAPANPLVPTAPTTPEPTEEPSPTTEPEETTEAPGEDSTTPTTDSTPSSPDTGTTESTTGSTTEPSDPTETSEPTSPTGTTSPTTDPSTSLPSPTG